MKTTYMLLACIFLLHVSGCTVIWTNEALIATLGKRYKMTDVTMVSEPNSVRIGSGEVETSNDKLKVMTPWGIGETK